MFVRHVRRAIAPRNLAATAILVLAGSTIAFAAIGSRQITNNSITGVDIRNNSLGTLDIQNNSLTDADVKNRSLRGVDLRNDAVTGIQVNESTLGTVPSATAADSATNATNATNAALADKAKGQTRFASGWLASSAEDNDPAVARGAATPVTLASEGSLSIQALCFRDVDDNRVYGELIATTTVDGAVMDSWWDNLNGGGTFNNASFLYTDTPRVDRQIVTSFADLNAYQLVVNNQGQVPFTLIALDGTYMTGGAQGMVRNGTPIASPTALPGTTHSCSFMGEVTHSGTA